MRVDFGFSLGHTTFVNHALDKSVIRAHLLKDAVLEPICPGIPNVGVGEAVTGEQQGRHRGAHASQFRIDMHQLGKQ